MRDSIKNVFRRALGEYLTMEGRFYLEDELSQLTGKMLETAVIEIVDDDCLTITTNRTLIAPDQEQLSEMRDIPDLLVFKEHSSFGDNTSVKEMLSDSVFTLVEYDTVAEVEHALKSEKNTSTVVLVKGLVMGYKLLDLEHDSDLYYQRYVSWGDDAYLVAIYDELGNTLKQYFNNKVALKTHLKQAVANSRTNIEVYSLLDKKELFFQVYEKRYDSTSSVVLDNVEDLILLFTTEDRCRTFDDIDDESDLVLPF
jgi:hypothetical protein